MNDLKQLRLFTLLCESSLKVEKQEMKCAYDSFLAEIEKLNQSESDYSKIFRILNLTRIEFDSLGSSSFYGQGGKMRLKKSILEKQFYFLNQKLN
ncbi:hypothetical protein [Dysgonomonas gadei]|uniref:Uncharacterized protein n=1 Tax=Dysgonomonas gadei ATCC BAA-286 TaxID=742766 RepID=F5J285_9BACT|nr:hypothetical protein [Dysgonomonas gadei]EGK00205.1 hypothetical protein HMPREF9455_03344 [Dysgonomonas gadei ATCC BAA-286]